MKIPRIPSLLEHRGYHAAFKARQTLDERLENCRAKWRKLDEQRSPNREEMNRLSVEIGRIQREIQEIAPVLQRERRAASVDLLESSAGFYRKLQAEMAKKVTELAELAGAEAHFRNAIAGQGLDLPDILNPLDVMRLDIHGTHAARFLENYRKHFSQEAV